MSYMDDPRYDAIMVSYYKRRQLDNMPDFMKQIRNVETAQSCVVLGAGVGTREVPFIRQCLPRLKSLTAVDHNVKTNEKFKEILHQEFPSLTADVQQSNLEDWAGPVDIVDVILAFHVLYFMKASDREELYQKCFQKWLKPNGKLIIMLSDEKNFTKVVLGKVLPHVKATTLQSINADLKALGYTVEKQYRCETPFDLADPDDDFLRLFQYGALQEHVELEPLRQAVKEISPDGKGTEMFGILVVSK